MAKKYYWLKLQKDFFKRHDIKIIENMPNGKDYILFYLKLLVESVTHNGELRFSETIPYSEPMLATITDTNIDIVRSAMKIFIELGMIEVLDNMTIFMTEVAQMVGSETQWADKKRQYRIENRGQIEDNVRKLSAECPTVVRQEIELEKEIEIDKEIDKSTGDKTPSHSKNHRFVKPSIDEVKAYCAERGNSVDPQRFCDYYDSNGWKVGKNPMKDWRAAVRSWEKSSVKEADKPRVYERGEYSL